VGPIGQCNIFSFTPDPADVRRQLEELGYIEPE
jgi:hypothetical protein